MRITITISDTENTHENFLPWEKTSTGYEKLIDLPTAGNPAVIERLADLMAQSHALRPSDIINREECIATTIWVEADIAAYLEQEGYEATEENVAAVMNSGELEALGDCQDSHWQIISNAIAYADIPGCPHPYDELESLLKNVVCFVKEVPDPREAEEMLLKMGFNKEQLKFLGFFYIDDESVPQHYDFRETDKTANSDFKAALNLLRRIVAWHKANCTDAKEALDFMGFDDDLLIVCNF